MQAMRWGAVVGLATLLGALISGPRQLPAETSPETFEIYTEHPRLFLRPQRLRLLRRERERNSMRWEQFHLLITGGAPMPEPGFAKALYYRLSDEKRTADEAIQWASAPGRELRQIALVYDWCQAEMTASQKQTLVERLRAGLGIRAATLTDFRGQVLAAVALAGDDEPASRAALKDFYEKEWRGALIPALRSGKAVLRGADAYPLLEIMHAFRDNLNIDLREDFPQFFHDLPLFDLLSYYPPPYPAAENEFHIPFSEKAGEPDLSVAALSRAGELAMVAFDTNAPESQVLQGWLMNDRFLMRGPLGLLMRRSGPIPTSRD